MRDSRDKWQNYMAWRHDMELVTRLREASKRAEMAKDTLKEKGKR